MPRESLGEFEHLVLAAILQVGEGAYGVPVIGEIEERTGRRVAPAAVYVTLRRLEEKGLVRSWLEDPADGKPRRFVELTRTGMERLRDVKQAMVRMWEGLDPILEDL